MSDCTIDLRQDVVYNLIINKNRDLNQQIQSEIYSGSSFVGYFDFTQYSGATLVVKIKPNDNYEILKFSTVDGSIVLSTDGIFILSKTADELKNIKTGECYYNMYLSSTLYNKRQFLSGKFIIVDNVG
jgi:hypothetical protein